MKINFKHSISDVINELKTSRKTVVSLGRWRDSDLVHEKFIRPDEMNFGDLGFAHCFSSRGEYFVMLMYRVNENWMITCQLQPFEVSAVLEELKVLIDSGTSFINAMSILSL